MARITTAVCERLIKENFINVLFLGFVIDVSILDLLAIDVYAIVRINRLIVLKDTPGKLVMFVSSIDLAFLIFRKVLQIVDMALVSKESICIGEPEPCQYLNNQGFTSTSTSASTSSASQNTLVSSTLQQPIYQAESLCTVQDVTPKVKRTLIVELSTKSCRE